MLRPLESAAVAAGVAAGGAGSGGGQTTVPQEAVCLTLGAASWDWISEEKAPPKPDGRKKPSTCHLYH